MGNIILNGITPAASKIKLGLQNVNKIYAGDTKVWPPVAPPEAGEVLIGDLVWKTYNEFGATPEMAEATTSAQAIDYLTNDTPSYVYYQFNSANISRGLLYNRQGADALTPPPGFRLPNEADFTNLVNALKLASSGTDPDDITLIGGGDPNFWPSTITSNTDFGTSGFDSKGSGFAYQSNAVLVFATNTEQYWANGFLNEDDTAGFSYYDAPFSAPDFIRYAVQTNNNKYAYVRFCRDY